jgi:hypothetical protein
VELMPDYYIKCHKEMLSNTDKVLKMTIITMVDELYWFWRKIGVSVETPNTGD